MTLFMWAGVLLVILAMMTQVYNETTQRVRGLYGKATLGQTVTATDIDAGGEVQSWTLDVTVDTEDSTCLADWFKVNMATGCSGTFSCRKLLLTDAVLAQVLLGNPLYVGLWHGRAQTATTGTGSMAAQGMVIITGYTRQNDRGPVLVNVTGMFTGAIAQS